MELRLTFPTRYRVKRGQTLTQIARTFSVPPRVLVAENNLTEEVCEGQLLRIPKEKYNLYFVQGGESETLLCGSPEQFAKKNKTSCLYPAQIVFL